MASIREDFVKFVKQGNLIQMAIAFVVGVAFVTLVTALVADIITPLIGVAGSFNFASWIFTINGSTFMQGAFLNALITFVVVLTVVFFAIALPYQRYQDRQKAKAPATTRPCPECTTAIPIAAKRCPACTSEVPPVPPTPPAPALPASS